MAGLIREIWATLSPDPGRLLPTGDNCLDRLDDRLTSLTREGADDRAPMMIRPGDCTVWNHNPRDQPGLTFDSCRSLIESIAAEGGNRIPVLVRMNRVDEERRYQLLAGSRRRFAVDWLNHNGRPEIRLQALLVDMSDEEAFRLADIENCERSDICDLDRARSYQDAVDRFYGGVQSRMAEALGLSNSQLSRLLALAQLPDEIVNAFAIRDELRVRYSELLTPLLRRTEQRDAIMAEARLIGAEQQRRAGKGEQLLAPATVLSRLRAAATPRANEDRRDMPILLSGQRVGRVRPEKGGFVVDLNVADDVDLAVLLEGVREAIDSARSEKRQ